MRKGLSEAQVEAALGELDRADLPAKTTPACAAMADRSSVTLWPIVECFSLGSHGRRVPVSA